MLSAVHKLADRGRRSFEFHRLRLTSEYWRKKFSNASPEDYINEPCGREITEVELISLSGKSGVPLACLCILSFLRHVGTPKVWTIVSDGTIDEAGKERLRRVFSGVRFTLWSDYINDGNRQATELYLQHGGLAKKLPLVTNLPPEGKYLYVDTDIVFFEGGWHLHDLLQAPTQNRFMLDNENGPCHPFHPPEELRMPPVNSGVLLQVQPIPWQPALDRLAEFFQTRTELLGDWKVLHHLEQTICHLGYNWSGAEPFPPALYLLKLEDAYELAEPCIQPDTVLRHYVVHTRMKFWLHARPYLK